MKVHILQHVPFEGPGSIAPWLVERGADVRYTRFFERDRLPDLDAVDLLIVMGGPMSVNDGALLPWLTPEKHTIREAIGRSIAVLGVCLGAQLIASALESRVYPNPVKEIGWFPIQGVCDSEDAFRFPSACAVFHWHGETFDLPAGAVRLARSAGCENQAFQWKRNVIGLQFHLEMTVDGVQSMVENCRDELVSGPYIQTEQDMFGMPVSQYQATNGLMGDVLAYLTDVRADSASRPTAAELPMSGRG